MSYRDRADEFCKRFALRRPILLAPMAGVSAPELSIAVANAGGLGACGALLMSPQTIVRWANEIRAASSGAFQINLWVPDPPPMRDATHEARIRNFLALWGPAVPLEEDSERPPNFDRQCEALIESGAPAVSSIMGLFPSGYVQRLKSNGIAWFAVAMTVAQGIADWDCTHHE